MGLLKLDKLCPLWLIQTELERDRDQEKMGCTILCLAFTLQLMWELKWDLYLCIVSVLVPVPVPHKFCLIRPLAPSELSEVRRVSKWYTESLSRLTVLTHFSGGSRIFPGGAPTPRGGGGGVPTYDFAKFSQKLHEIERI